MQGQPPRFAVVLPFAKSGPRNHLPLIVSVFFVAELNLIDIRHAETLFMIAVVHKKCSSLINKTQKQFQGDIFKGFYTFYSVIGFRP